MGDAREIVAGGAKKSPAAALFLVVASGISLAATFSEDAVKAAYLHRFASYVYWPDESQPSTQLVIGVFGADTVAGELERLLPVGTQGRRIIVVEIEAGKKPAPMHILYIGPGRLAEARDVLLSVRGQPVLVVTDDENGLARGGTINFLRVNRNVRFEISLESARIGGLKISSGLLSVAARVEGVEQDPAG
jgi:hypothetical protein